MNKFIYRIIAHEKESIYHWGSFHRLHIEIHELEPTGLKDYMNLEWQANADDKNGDNSKWYGMRITYKAESFNMLSLLKKFKDNRLGGSPEDAIMALEQNGIRPGTHTEIVCQNGSGSFHGFISKDEILKGKVKRYGNMVYVMSDQKRSHLMKQLKFETHKMDEVLEVRSLLAH